MATQFDDQDVYLMFSGSSWTDAWPGHTDDNALPQYHNSTFHGSTNNGDSCTIAWHGTDISFYGARRNNHGIYGVVVDGGNKQYYSGYSQTDEFQQLLYASSGLSAGDHNIVLSNENARNTAQYPNYIWFDVDYVAVSGSLLYVTGDRPAPTTETTSSSSTSSTTNPTSSSFSPQSSAESSPTSASSSSSSFTQISSATQVKGTSTVGPMTGVGQFTHQTTEITGTATSLDSQTTGTPVIQNPGSTTSTGTTSQEGDHSGSSSSSKTTAVAVSVTVIVVAVIVILTIGGL